MAKTVKFDDRVDTDTEITTREALSLLGRSLGFLSNVRVLFFWKLVFANVAVRRCTHGHIKIVLKFA